MNNGNKEQIHCHTTHMALNFFVFWKIKLKIIERRGWSCPEKKNDFPVPLAGCFFAEGYVRYGTHPLDPVFLHLAPVNGKQAKTILCLLAGYKCYQVGVNEQQG